MTDCMRERRWNLSYLCPMSYEDKGTVVPEHDVKVYEGVMLQHQ